MEKNLSIKTIVAIGIGAAVFMILGRFGSIPTGIPNTNIETSYAFLALMAVLYGPIAGLSIGFIGHALKDLVFYGSPWFSWVIASAVVGLILGLSWKKLKVNEGEFEIKEIILFNAYQVIANMIAWLLIAPTLDVFIYAEPANKVYLQGIVAAISNSITVGVLGTILVYTYAKTRVKKGSLDRE
ncbi:ECF-type riboflavin transporter substrate-binding protein [Clostridium nigeriense]|uniref:ECF-type riboflavin transporter substrate-binding protein n=1 Tax=Clostridium nigeriense TaxID=1805470 RepID=UPI0008308A0C|nr:ECF-type riboflavin transporter substrate-binding protein [Clostridium nigeriense]